MLAALETMRGEFSFEAEVVDIDACPEKLEKFDQWVPVLTLKSVITLRMNRLYNASLTT